jgi:hypothetical protein
MAKYVFVTGGVTSSLGKGITAASIGRILKSRGVSVSVLKLDPYINVDPGTMSTTGPRPTSTWGTTSGSSTRTSPSSPT